MGANIEEDYDDVEEMDEFDHPLPTGQRTVDSIYSDNTIKLYKQLIISYAIDGLSHNIFEYEDEEDWEEEYDEDEEPLEEEEISTPEELTREQKIKLENERLEKEEKEKEEKKLRNKIKNFLGFNKKED